MTLSENPPQFQGPRTGAHLHDLLGPWVPHQRWYPAKGREARTEVLGRILLPWAEEDDVRVLVHVLRVEGAAPGAPVDVVQVPLVHRRAPLTGDRAAAALLGVLTDPDGVGWYVYDGPHDPAYVDALLGLLSGSVRGLGLDASGERDEAGGSAAGHHPPGTTPLEPGAPARVLRGEQSNTSIIVEPRDAPPRHRQGLPHAAPGPQPRRGGAGSADRHGHHRRPGAGRVGGGRLAR